MISTSEFAKEMNVHYRTALNWLNAGLVPGAVERTLPGETGGSFWEIPASAVKMEKPKRGPKKGAKYSKTQKETVK
ncbi:MAG TPA: hypothetical protein VIC84_22250 [Blastocatellia bacterium]|jgi:hypothetical protein